VADDGEGDTGITQTGIISIQPSTEEASVKRYVVVICPPGVGSTEYRLPPPFDTFDERAEAELVRDWYRACAVGPARATADAFVREIEEALVTPEVSLGSELSLSGVAGLPSRVSG
jgi:hypothetical protein